jgi:hypothetical protein
MELNWWEDGRNNGGCVGDGRNGVGGFSWDFWKKLTKDGKKGEEDERSKNVFFRKAKCEWCWCAKCGRWTQSCLERKIEMFDFGKEGNYGRVIVWFLRSIQEAGSLHSWSHFCKCRCEEFCERRTWLVVRTFRCASNLAKLM